MSVALRPRDRVRLQAVRRARAPGVDTLETRHGRYHMVDDLAGITHRRAEDTLPPFDNTSVVTSDPNAIGARIAMLTWGRIVVAHVVNADPSYITEKYSDDDGTTWEEGITMFTGATYCDIAVDPRTGVILRAALISGTIYVSRQWPGEEAPEAAQATSVTLDEGQFSIAPSSEQPGRWLLAGIEGGLVEFYVSADDGLTWESV